MTLINTMSRPDPISPPSIDRAGLCMLLAATGSAFVVATGMGPLMVHVVAGLFLLIVIPVVLVNAKVDWPDGVKLHESLLYSLALVLLTVMLGGLAINALLPFLGVARPLDRVPVAVSLIIAVACLGLWRARRWRWHNGRSAAIGTAVSASTGWRDQLVLSCAVLVAVGARVGPIRLNNGASGSVTTAALILAAIVIVMAFSWRRILRESTIVATIYLLSLSLLLMTSLRGRFITGHDIQREFRVFELTSTQGIWNIEAFRDSYNACLSINILPTIIARVTGIPDLYIFKTIFQLLFALCPVLVYLISRRFAARSVAILAAVYFVTFPAYFGDMPFLNRQEVAFFFLGVALLLITDPVITTRKRKIGLVVFGLGIVLSHYSTTYVLLGVLIVSWMGISFAKLFRKIKSRTHRGARHRKKSIRSESARVITLVVIVSLTTFTFLWTGPITGTGGHAEKTVVSTFNAIMNGGGGGERSSDTSYSIFGGTEKTPEELMGDYRKAAIEATTEGRNAGEYYPLSETDKYALPVRVPEQLPVTTLGKGFEAVGIDVPTVNAMLRTAASILLQLFIGLGLLLALFRRIPEFRPSPEYVAGAVGCVVVIGLQVVLPNLSVDYGLLRTFAQALFWLAPFVAAGSIQAFGWLGRSRSATGALGVAVVFFLSLTGVIPQVLGGYPAQLHLNNAGPYYDRYYLHTQDASGVKWLQHRITTDKDPAVQYQVATGLYAFTPGQISGTISEFDDLYPVLVRKGAYVFLGSTPMRTGVVSSFFQGDEVAYEYPIGFLDHVKSLVYSNANVRIYR